MHKLICLLVALSAALPVTAETGKGSRNMILIIGDGFDDQHVTMGRNYLVGMSGKLILDTMPYRASVQVETVSEQGQPLYVPIPPIQRPRWRPAGSHRSAHRNRH